MANQIHEELENGRPFQISYFALWSMNEATELLPEYCATRFSICIQTMFNSPHAHTICIQTMFNSPHAHTICIQTMFNSPHAHTWHTYEGESRMKALLPVVRPLVKL